MKVMSISVLAPPPPPAHGAFHYPQDLLARLSANAAAPKAQRTRLRLMAAIAALLEDSGFHDLRVADCAARAGLAHGTFYRYWPDRGAAAQDVLSDFMATITARRPPRGGDAPLFDRILAANRYYVAVYRQNAGLMRCLMQLGNSDPAFARIGQAANLALARRVVRAWEREDARAAQLPEQERIARALACIAMVEGVLREFYVRPVPEPLAAMREEEVADLISACWFRTLLGREPPSPPRA